MKVLKKFLKGKEGEISLMVDSLEDLWHLKYIIDPNDVVFSLTKRKPEGSSDKIRPEKLERVTVRLGVRVESTEFHKFSNRLRIQGVIVSGMDVGAYHTLNIDEGTELTISKKEWKSDQIERIKEAEEASKRPSVIMVGIEEGDADIGLVRHYGIELHSHIRQSSGKRVGSLRESFFEEIANQLAFVYNDNTSVILCGPGFTKDDFLDKLKISHPEIASNVGVEDSSMIGISGFMEVLRKGSVDKIMKESRISREAEYMEELFKEIATDGKATYGSDEVRKAIDYGAVEVLLVADEKIRAEREDTANRDDSEAQIDQMMKDVELAQGNVVVLSTEFEPGSRLESLGGIAALLRFKMV